MMIPATAYAATLEVTCAPSSESTPRRAIAELLDDQLGEFGFRIMAIDDRRDEDVTWVELANIPPFVIQVGIFEDARAAGRLFAFIYPPLPFVRVWLRKVSTAPIVKRLGEAVKSIFENSADCSEVRWLSEKEIRDLWPQRPR